MESVKISIKEKDIEKGMENLAEEWKKEVTLPGFRKGKAPIQLIKSRLREQLRAEALEKLIGETMVSAMEKYEPFIYGPPQLKNFNESDGNVEFETLLDVPPNIDIDLTNIKIEKGKKKDIEISGELKRLQEINSELQSVSRGIKKGDVVFLDIIGSDESISNYSFTVQNDSFSQEIEGLKGAEEKEVETKFPEDIPIRTLAGKKSKAMVKIVEVKKQVLPKLNDDFAKDLGFDNMKELKVHLKEGITDEAAEEQKEAQKREILEELVNLSKDVEVSPALLDIQKGKGLSEENAIRGAKELILLDAIAVKEGLSVEEKELDEWMEKIAESQDDEMEEMGEEAIRFVKRSILRNKALDYIVEKVKKEGKVE